MRSPSETGTGTFVAMGSGASLIFVPFADPGSISAQEPSGCATRIACRCETPGSSGGPLRSISGLSPRDRLRRPIRTWLPTSGNTRSGQYGGKTILAASGPPWAMTESKYCRSAETTACQPVYGGPAGAPGGAPVAGPVPGYGRPWVPTGCPAVWPGPGWGGASVPYPWGPGGAVPCPGCPGVPVWGTWPEGGPNPGCAWGWPG